MTHFFEDKQQYLAFQQAFRKLSREKNAKSHDHILYNFIRGCDLKFGFSPLKNPNKIDPYHKDEWKGFTAAKSELLRLIKNRKHYAEWYQKYGQNDPNDPIATRFNNTITEEMWDKIYEALK